MSFKMKPQWRQQKSSLGRHLPVQEASSLEGSSNAFHGSVVDKYDPMPGETPAAQQKTQRSSCSRREQGRKLQRMCSPALWGKQRCLATCYYQKKYFFPLQPQIKLRALIIVKCLSELYCKVPMCPRELNTFQQTKKNNNNNIRDAAL